MRLVKEWIAGSLAAFVLILSAAIAGCAMGKDNKRRRAVEQGDGISAA